MNLSCTLEAIDILHKPDLLTKFRDLNIQLNFYHGFFDCDHELIKQQLVVSDNDKQDCGVHGRLVAVKIKK